MKKQIKMIGFAALSSLFVIAGAMAADAGIGSQLVGNDSAICDLIREFKGIFGLLRTLAFVGAGFVIAGWGWGYISKTDEIKMDDVKKKGLSMLVGFALLFGIGVLLQLLSAPSVITDSLGCSEELFKNW